MIIIHQPKASGNSLKDTLGKTLEKKVACKNMYFDLDQGLLNSYAKIDSNVFSCHLFPTPEAISFMESITEDNKVIVLLRDPDKATESLMERHPGHSIKSGMGGNYNTVGNIMKWFNSGWKSLPYSKNVLYTCYESLIDPKEQERELHKIYDFLDVPYEKRIMSYSMKNIKRHDLLKA